jgi:hypothetical protein
MTDTLALTQPRRIKWRRIVLLALSGCVVYFLSAGPVTRLTPEFADWFYAPLGLLADIPLAGSILRAWLSLWGVDVS